MNKSFSGWETHCSLEKWVPCTWISAVHCDYQHISEIYFLICGKHLLFQKFPVHSLSFPRFLCLLEKDKCRDYLTCSLLLMTIFLFTYFLLFTTRVWYLYTELVGLGISNCWELSGVMIRLLFIITAGIIRSNFKFWIEGRGLIHIKNTGLSSIYGEGVAFLFLIA